MQKNKMKLLFGICCILSLGLITPIHAGETGHYKGVIRGIKAATLPPPGFYYVAYNVYYNSDTSMNQHGDEKNIGFDLNSVALSNRLVWITNQKILGADFGMNMVIPLVNTDIEIDAFNVQDEQSGIGDVFVESFLGWHEARYDATIAVGLYMPTGDYDVHEPASLGKDFWTAMLSLGGTYYFDSKKLWSLSILGRYETHSEKDSVDVKPGDDFGFEWGLANAVTPTIDMGVTGYAHWQVSDDSGSAATWDTDVHDQVFSIGPEVKIFIPSITSFVTVRFRKEFGAEDRAEGQMLTLSLAKRF
ncbi:transporter [Candidatus Halobeggiatoa sp. HSG11]|nr:transporter [Candidatus Halobeggiatoa sp. HSG11]